MYDLIIVGGGPAGLTAAVYAVRKRLHVLLVSEDLGGKTNYQMSLPWMETHQAIRGVDIVNKFRRELQYLDFAHRLEPVNSISKSKAGSFLVETPTVTLEAKIVIVATGSRVKHLDVPGEHQFIGLGVTYSAISYAPLFIGRP